MDLVAENTQINSRRLARRTQGLGLWRAFWKKPTDRHRNRLVELYQPLVKEVVYRLAMRVPRSVDRGDMETAANFGLMGAVASFDPTRNVRFEIYAEMRIRGAVLDELRAQDWLPRPWRTRLDRQKRTVELLRSELGREPTDPEVALVMDIPFDEYEMLFGTALPGTQAGMILSPESGDDPVSRLDVVADPRNDQPGDKLTQAELLRLVSQRLSELECRIVYLKYWEELSMREIGELTRLSESRVCKIHARLLERLRDRFRGRASDGVS